MKKRFIELFTYNDWANEQIISALVDRRDAPEKCKTLISHIISAQDTWLERVTGTNDWNIDLWETFSLHEVSVLSQQSSQNWLRHIRKLKLKDFDELIRYKNSKGNHYETPLLEIVDHVLMHSAYHRGQINQLLRENGFDPVYTDYIYYTRI